MRHGVKHSVEWSLSYRCGVERSFCRCALRFKALNKWRRRGKLQIFQNLCVSSVGTQVDESFGADRILSNSGSCISGEGLQRYSEVRQFWLPHPLPGTLIISMCSVGCVPYGSVAPEPLLNLDCQRAVAGLESVQATAKAKSRMCIFFATFNKFKPDLAYRDFGKLKGS
ncbi:hypothetical protein M758_5G184200 [Ceratodon purpureus]|nr:hypothetical protein M758_5G184200 [Ceratodon purpureus]